MGGRKAAIVGALALIAWLLFRKRDRTQVITTLSFPGFKERRPQDFELAPRAVDAMPCNLTDAKFCNKPLFGG